MAIPGLREYQREALRSLQHNLEAAPGETLTVMFPRQAGKNEISARLVAGLLLANSGSGGSIVICAPSFQPQARLSLDRTYNYLRRRAGQLSLAVRREGPVIRCGHAEATFLSASPSANVAGHTASLLLIGDEAQDIDADWFNRQFKPMTSSTGASTVLFGTPWSGNSLLEDAIEQNRRHDATLTGTADQVSLLSRHHEFRWPEVARYNPPYGRFVKLERDRLGAGHPVFRSQYELEAAASLDRLLSPANLRAIAGDFEAPDGPATDDRYVAGLDFAGDKEGGDSTVLTIGRCHGGGMQVVAVQAWTGTPYETQIAAVAMLARHWGIERMVCDATGMGASLVALLRKELKHAVQPLTFSRPEKSSLGFALQAAAETHRLAIPRGGGGDIARLWRELRLCKVELAGKFQIGWAAPSGEHDDCVASLALCLRAAEGLGGERRAFGRGRAA
ncbi:MAG: hypothetical protein U0837_07505 [Dehalococcoidia bacterium]